MRKLLLNITKFVNIIHNVNIINTINIVNISTKSELESAKEFSFEAPLPPSPHTPQQEQSWICLEAPVCLQIPRLGLLQLAKA